MRPRTVAAVSRLLVRREPCVSIPLLYGRCGSLTYDISSGRPLLASIIPKGRWRSTIQNRSNSSNASTAIRVLKPGQSGHETPITTENVFIALGSNVGDRLENIERACSAMDAEADIKVIRTSALYETEAMYVEDQARFLNAVCKIRTSLQPLALLDALQAIEKRLGREKTIDKGPRNIDLDILLYGNEHFQSERLTLPHPLMLEREFVLRPLCDINAALAHNNPPDGRQISYSQVLRQLGRARTPMYSSTPLATGCELHANKPTRRTQIMSILNVTPDSFSDGGDNEAADTEGLSAVLQAQITAGATIIDVGGQSSRPNAPDVTAEKEIARVMPAIEIVKRIGPNVSISVDTYRAAVAEAAVKAGAHIVNDISAGQLDPDMLPTVARLGCTYIMMHMRGTPSTMQDPKNCTYSDGLIPTIARELRGRINAAQEAGIRRWRIILDPGIGFSKTVDQNLEILRNFSKLRATQDLQNIPWLLGSSRKGFIGKITGVDAPKERVWGTAATVTAAVQGGADIVRVHDVAEMACVLKMADAMYRIDR